MLTPEELDRLRAAGRSGDGTLTRYLAALDRRTARIRDDPPPLPRVKALLSRDGGVCPDDGTPLRFDPWSPDRHQCPRCQRPVAGERHHRHWARAQHLWLAGRAAELALIAAIRDDPAPAARALEIIAGYEELYFALPNRDNVLGPTHLFFSTYLESLWINAWLAAAVTLRQAGRLPEERIAGINRVADEAATLIAEFNEGLSNRQTWHAAALAAIAVWFEDAELLGTAVESRAGLVGHLADGFGSDGLWWEGENYHLFALRGLIHGIRWARVMDYDILEDREVLDHFRAALLAPARTALPDFTYPARGDSRYGVSLAHPASLELWELGRLWLDPDEELEAWLSTLYTLRAPPLGDPYDAWLEEAGLEPPERRQRTDLSWWAAPAMLLDPPRDLPWQPESRLLPAAGLAILRRDRTYASLECGPRVAGHGHPDRLHLTVHARGVHWLPDPGTGSYVADTLRWYRSSLAHNAPIVAGENAGGRDAWCAAFEAGERHGWCRGRAGGLTRTVIAGPGRLIDVLSWSGEKQEIVLPWHVAGEIEVAGPGGWEPAELDHPFVTGVERHAGDGNGAWTIRVRSDAGETLPLHLRAPGAELIRARGPGLPGDPASRCFLLLRATTPACRWIAALDLAEPGGEDAIVELRDREGAVEIVTRAGLTRYDGGEDGLLIESPAGPEALGGLRPAPRPHRPLFEPRPEPEALALAPRIAGPPALDGTLEGFDPSAPLRLDEEHQYRRSEEPYDPDRFAAEAWVNWDGDALYVAVEVRKPDLLFRPADAPPLELDNEPDDVNSDGLQLFLGHEADRAGVLVIPEPDGSLRWRPIEPDRSVQVAGAWQPTGEGYRVTLALTHPLLARAWPGMRLGFDLLINEMQPGRTRRAGQLVWSGGDGWIYLRGDRQDPSAFGVLELGP
jgi:hypothetical protein